MREGWQTKTLGEVLCRTESVNPAASPDVDFDYIDVSSVSYETFVIETTQRMKGKDAPSRARRLVRSRDVLFATIRPTLKRIAITPDTLDRQVGSTGYFVMRPNEEVDHRFLFYFLFTDQFMGAMAALQKGASYPAVTDAEVRAQSIMFPAICEQRRIVAILDEAVEGIATAKAHAEKNLRNARELFSAALARLFPASRAEVALVELADSISDGDHAPPPKAEDGVPFITISNIDKATRQIDFADTFLVPRGYYDGLKSHRRPVAGDVLYTVTGSFGIPVLVTVDREFCFQRHIGLIRPKQTVDAAWLTYALLSPMAFAQANQRATGTAQRTVSLSVLRDLRLPDLPAEEQRRVAEEIAAIESRARELEACLARKLAALDELKQSLLPQAFSGEL